jgi:predicted nucleotide-binding protein
LGKLTGAGAAVEFINRFLGEMSRPLTEKFEDEAQTCSFAFAIFTPDDEVVKPDKPYKQARPNVIYEVGWFKKQSVRSI